MELNLSNKNVLITGSSRGIGKSIAEEFALNGSQVILNSRDSIALGNLTKSIPNSIGISADVSKYDEAKFLVERTIKEKGAIDILICNVGSGNSSPPGEEKLSDWQNMFSLNFYSAINVIEVAKKHLIKSKGAIICISSICGSTYVEGAPITYSTSKAALNSYIKMISKPLGKKGVRINGVAPGNILFENSVWDKKIKDNSKKVYEFLHKQVPLERFGKPYEVAKLVCYLSSDIASFTTGSIWTIDGGQSS